MSKRFTSRMEVKILLSGQHQNKTNTMTKKIQEQHTKAAECCKAAASHHEQAAVHVAAGEHEAAAHHAQCAQGHQTSARHHADEVATLHGTAHGQK